MGNPTSSFTLGIPFASTDGKFYSRYPQGDRFAAPAQASGALVSVAASSVNGSAGQPSDADWTARSTAAGVYFANRLETQVAIDTYGFQDSFQPRLPVLDTVIKPTGAVGSAKLSILNSDETGVGLIRIPFGRSFIAGQTFWVSFRTRVPPECAYMDWPTPDETGLKSCIISHTSSSNINDELVVQDTDMGSRVMGYYQDGNTSAVHAVQGLSTQANGADFSEPAAIDRSVRPHNAAFTTFPLTGTDPDTGAAWTTYQQERARYGLLYSARSSPGTPDTKPGLGDPLSGAARLWPGEWVTITQRMIIGQYGQANNRWTTWMARDGGPYVLCWDLKNIQIGNIGLTLPYNCLWLLGYVSSRTTGGRSVSSRTSNIGGVTIHAVGRATTAGVGVLEYNATTQRFRWHGSGESFGTARGFSVANGKTRLNVVAAAPATGSWVVIEVTNSAALPPSGTVTDNVTIASVRTDTQVNFADVIYSTQAINAPGGAAPTDIDGTALQQAIAVAGTNAWGTFQLANTMALDPSGTGNSFMSFSHRASWDPINHGIQFGGGSHGTSGTFQRNWLGRYMAATNTWNAAIAIPGGVTVNPTHGYWAATTDTLTGDFYCVLPFSDTATIHRYRPSTGTWDTPLPTKPGRTEQSAALEYHPNLNNGQGALLYGNGGGIWSINLRNPTSWTLILDRTNPVDAMRDGGFAVSCYCRKDDAVYMGGGFTTNFGGVRSLWKVPAGVGAGTPNGSTIAQPPVEVEASSELSPGIWDSGNIANGMVIIDPPQGNTYEYNATTNTWSSSSHNVPAAITNAPNRWHTFATCYEYGGILAFTGNNTPTTDTTLHFWKH